MCLPAVPVLAAANLALQTGSALMAHKAQGQAYNANKDAAERAYETNFSSLGTRETQESQATAQTIMGADRQARQEDAIARVNAGSAGIGGASIDAILQDIERQRMAFKDTENTNLSMTENQLEMDKQSGRDTMLSRVQSVRSPNPFVTGLQIGGAAIDTAGTMQRYFNPRVGG